MDFSIKPKGISAITLLARKLGAKIIHAKRTDYVEDDFWVVMAKTNQGEFVTWLFANDGFHHGHYFRNDLTECVLDFMGRKH
jgi:hypothetical protein